MEKLGNSWTLAGLQPEEAVDETAAQSIVNRVATISLTRPLGLQPLEDYGLEAPSSVVTIRSIDDTGVETVDTLIFGAKDEENNSYVLSASRSPYFVEVSGFTGDELAGKTRRDLLILPPTPSPTP